VHPVEQQCVLHVEEILVDVAAKRNSVVAEQNKSQRKKDKPILICLK
jgi:hypothetical protein